MSIPTTKAEFEKMVAEKSDAEAWPQALKDRAERLILALGTLDQKAIVVTPLLRELAAKDVEAFAQAYAAFNAARAA